MTKYVVHLNPTIDGTGKDMPNTFEIDAASFLIEEGIAVVKVNRAASAEA